MSKKGKSYSDEDDIRVRLKLPRRNSLRNREVSLAALAMRKALSTSGRKGRGGGKARAGAGAVPSAGGQASGRPGGSASTPSKSSGAMQRVSVRWTYAKNKSDGQWGAHGRYLERESAQERAQDADLAMEADREAQPSHEVDELNLNEKEQENGRSRESDERYELAARAGRSGNTPLRESDIAGIAGDEAPESLHRVRGLSSIPLAHYGRRLAMLLPGNAALHMDRGRAEGVDGVRRGSDGQSRAGNQARGRSGRARGERRVNPFGSADVSGSITETLTAWQADGDKHLFKVIVSPEFGERMDLRKHVRDLMNRMEKDLGTKLQWIAIDHYNTDNPHVHIAIRGVNDRGQTLEVDPTYIKSGSRQRAEELATRTLGFRTDRDVAEAFERQVTQHRFTDLDRMLLKMARGHRVEFAAELPKSERARDARVRALRRLAELVKMGLAQRVDSHAWTLSPDLEAALRARQIAEDRLKTKFLHRETISDARAPMVTTELKTVGQRVAGRLVGTGLNEASGRPYMLIEGFDGQVHFVHQPPKVERMRGAGELRSGDFLALEVAARRDDSGKAVGTYVRVDRYGPDLTHELLDKEMLASGRAAERTVQTGTVATDFNAALATRQAKLIEAGAIFIRDGRVVQGSREAFDRVRFADAGVDASDFKYEKPTLARVVVRGSKSVVVESLAGKREVLSAERLASMGMDFKYVTPGGTMFFGQDDKHKTIALGIRVERIAEVVDEPKINRLDTIARQLTNLPASHPLAPVLEAREKVWRERGISIASRDFVKDAAAWTKNQELAASAELQSMVTAARLNRLDWLMQQPYVPASAPLAQAVKERADVWLERGVDPRDGRFAILAAVWRKGDELREAIELKGDTKVLEELGREKGKATRTLECEPGRQISGRVLAVAAKGGHTAVVVDTGGELTLIRQPAGQAVDVRAGMRVRAQAVEDVAGARRTLLWRFADLERQQALAKNKSRGRDLF